MKRNWSKAKIRRITFLIITLVLITIAAIFYNCNFEILGKWSDFISQICIGAATGCFVVVLQESVKEEENKIAAKNRKEKKSRKGEENGKS